MTPRITVLPRGSGRCDCWRIIDGEVAQCPEPASVRCEFGDPQIANRLCWECYEAQREPGEPSIEELRQG